MEEGTIHFDNFDEAYQAFQCFLEKKDSTLIARLINTLMDQREYDWVSSFLSEDIIEYIEKTDNVSAKLRLYSAIVYLSFLNEQNEKILRNVNKIAKLDKCELPNMATSYMIGITSLLNSGLYEEAVSFADKLSKRIDIFPMPKGVLFSALVKCYQVYSNIGNPNIELVNNLKSRIEKILEDEEFRKTYGDIYDFVKLKADWMTAKKANNLYKKKLVADVLFDKLKDVLGQKEIDLSIVDTILDMLWFYIEINCEDPLFAFEETLFDNFTLPHIELSLYHIYGDYYYKNGNTEKAFMYYKKYADGTNILNERTKQERKVRYKDIFKQAQLSNENESLHKIIMYDESTNCYSREYLKSAFQKEFNGTLFLIDLDGLKTINDEFGHLFGNKYIEYFSRVLKKNVEKRSGDVYRFGGDEFVVTFSSLSHKEAKDFIDEVYKEFGQPHNVMNQVMFFKFSTGITISENRPLSIAFNEADQAMYKMKATSKNHYYFY